ncbi:MAG: S41 family peptidase, partial [Candidatus Brocadiia bacterium]
GMPFPGVGYVRATLFGGQMTSKVYEAMKKLQTEGAKSYILDLRNNPGGEAMEAVNLCDLFLRGRKVATIMKFFTAGQAMTQSMLCFGNETEFESVPLVVLVNDSSASASEMASGCLQDHGRATIVGTQTYGKGVAQAARGLLSSHGTRFLYLTTAKYALPSGRSIHKTGVTPDIVVKDGDAFSGTEAYYRVLGWERTRSFVQRLISRYPAKAAAIARGEAVRIDETRDLDSLRRKTGSEFGREGSDALLSALRTEIAAEYCLNNVKFQPFDVEDEALVMAVRRLNFESGTNPK